MKRLMLSLGIWFLAVSAQAYVALVNKADHTEMHVVPAPGAVTIDGKLDDWDLSGAITMFIDESSKAAYSVNGALMYDKDYLYVSAHVMDPTPMLNNYTFGGEVNSSWNADSIQLFLLANQDLRSRVSTQGGETMSPDDQKYINMLWMWYSTQDKAAGYFSFYTLEFKDATLNPAGVKGAYIKDADGKGYTMEYCIPWSVTRAPRPPVGGDRMQFLWQSHWGNEQGMGVRCGMTDVRNPEGQDLGYQGPRSWGTAIFETTGNLQRADKGGITQATGHISVVFKLDKPSKVSIAVCNADGMIIRTCLGAQPYPAGEQTYLWDGLNDFGKPVPAGDYTVKMLTHDGIVQKYVCDIGVSGTPPYQTENGSGGWAGDYNMPQSMGAEGDNVVLGTANAEAMTASICTDLEGRKRYGTVAVGTAVTLHKGFAYFLSRGGAKVTKISLENGLLTPFSSGRPEAPLTTRRPGESRDSWSGRSWQMYGITVVGSNIVASSLVGDMLHRVDLESGEPRGEFPLGRPFGLATAPDGTLYAVSSNAVVRYDFQTKSASLILGDLDEPKQLACDAAGNLYVGLQGKTMQVWKLSASGKVLQKFGVPGGRPFLGKFDPNGMLNPYGIAVDKNGRLWVAEADNQPKRYSVWNADGSLWKEFFGSMDYSTRAYVDPEEPEYIYAQAVRYRVDYDKGTWAVDSTIIRPRDESGIWFTVPSPHIGGFFSRIDGRRFLSVGGILFGTAQGMTIYEDVKGKFVPRFCESKEGGNQSGKVSLWVDINNDGVVQTNTEVRPWGDLWCGYNGPNQDDKLNQYWWPGEGWAPQGQERNNHSYKLMRTNFKGFNEQGGLMFGNKKTATLLAHDLEGGAIAAMIPSKDGSVYSLVSGGSLLRGQRHQGSGHRVVKFGPDGKKLWEYHNVHCAFAWTSDPYTPGYLVSAIGFVPECTDDLVGVTGYYGQYFLLDAKDGLFLDALGEDQRSNYKLGSHMVLTENFNGTLFKHKKTGKIYFLGGDADCRLWELTGLDSVKRQKLALQVAPEQVAKAQAAAKQNSLAALAGKGKSLFQLPRLKGAAADGKFDEWAAVRPLVICSQGKRVAQAQVGWDDNNLYARFQIGDESPFLNTPTDQRLLFKSGDAVELYLATDTQLRGVEGQNKQEMKEGDLRLIIARKPDGKLVATVYRYVTTGMKKDNAFSVETTSSGKDTLDEVVPWNDLPMNVVLEKDGYVVEVAVPWKELGVTPASGRTLLGDLGVIYGNEGGTRNAIRYMWSDKSPEVSINNDIPSEIRIHPNQWGNWILE